MKSEAAQKAERPDRPLTPLLDTGGARNVWLEAAAAAFPDASRDGCMILGKDHLSVAVQVGRDVVVRFPRCQYGLDRLRSEITVLSVLPEAMSVTVPTVLAAELDLAGLPYVAHRVVHGMQLGPQLIRKMAPTTVRSIGITIGTFLSELEVLTQSALDSGVPLLTLPDFAAALWLEVELLLVDLMTPQARGRARRELAALSSAYRGHMLLCHANLAGNIVYEAFTGRLGVIDFGSAFVSDPVLDFASLLALSRNLALAATRRSPILKGRLDEAKLVRSSFLLQRALAAVRQEDREGARNILVGYE